jgi:hypothetical protein
VSLSSYPTPRTIRAAAVGLRRAIAGPAAAKASAIGAARCNGGGRRRGEYGRHAMGQALRRFSG